MNHLKYYKRIGVYFMTSQSNDQNITQSKYHHFVPQFYLNYFTDDSGYLYVYDKEKMEIRKSLPKNILGRNRLNTITYPDGSKGDWIEQQYSSIENLSSPVFKKISKSKQTNTGITHMDKLYLSLFMSTQFWRLPLNRPVVDKYMNKNDLSFISLSLNKVGKIISNQDETDFYKKIKATELFQKAYPLIAGLTRPMNNGAYDDLVDWHFMYQDPGFHLTSDNPIIYRDTPKDTTIFKNMIFPITPSRVLLSSKNPPQNIESFELNIQQFYQAERYVVGNRQDYLIKMAEIYEQFKPMGLGQLKDKIFNNLL